MRNVAFGITVFPLSWAWGVWSKPHKKLLAVGPIRFVWYPDVQGAWKEAKAA